jgi:hypothetical protein
MFRTPSLRNGATRCRFFRNGAFSKLEDVLAFYVERDIHPLAHHFLPHVLQRVDQAIDSGFVQAPLVNIEVDQQPLGVFGHVAGDGAALPRSNVFSFCLPLTSLHVKIVMSSA